MIKYEKERRGLEFRVSEETEGKMILEGYPIVFEQETLIGDEERGFYEIIDRDAFKDADMSDVCLRYNHKDGFLILARTRNKSLEFKIDDVGVFMSAELIPTTTNKDVYLMAQAELLSKGSFAFTVADQKVSMRDGKKVRRITKIDKCFDVSVVDIPAYDGTSIYARSLELSEEWSEPVETEEVEQNYKMSERCRHLILLQGGKYYEDDSQRVLSEET